MKTPLGNVSEIQVGYQSREAIRAHPNGSYWLIQARDFDKQHQVQWSNLIQFTPSGNTSKYELKPGDVLFLAKGQENFACLVNQSRPNTLAANTFYILRARPGSILPDYLAWWLNQTSAQEWIRLNRSGSSLPFLSVSALSRIEVPIPGIEIQRKIGDLEMLRKKEADLLGLYLSKKSVLIQTVCLNAIIE